MFWIGLPILETKELGEIEFESTKLLFKWDVKTMNKFSFPTIIAFIFLVFSSPLLAEADGPDYFRVTGVDVNDVLNIRSGASVHSEKIGSIPYDGDGVRNMGCEGRLSFQEFQEASDEERAAAEMHVWCKIEFLNTEGWVAGRYLEESSWTSNQNTDALVAGTEFNATGQIPCARFLGQTMNSCDFGVVRKDGGTGWITVFWNDGSTRVIFLEEWAPFGFDKLETDNGVEFTVAREADLFFVRIGDQRFEIPGAIISGG